MVNKDFTNITEVMEHYNKIQRFEVAVGYMTISTVCVALLGLFAKLGMQISSLTLFVFLRFFVPFLICAIVMLPLGTFKKLKEYRKVGNHFLRSIAAVASQYFLFYCLTRVQLFNAMMLWNTAPIFIPLVSFFLYRHHISKATWVSVILGLIGVICVIKPDKGIIDLFSIWGVLAGVATAFSQTLYGHNTRKAPADVNILLLFLSSSLISFVGLVIAHVVLKNDLMQTFEPVFANGFTPYAYIVLLALASIGNQIFKGIAYRHSRPGTLSPFFYLAVVFSGLLGWIVFDHIPDFLAILGMVLIIFSSVIRITFAPKTEQTK